MMKTRIVQLDALRGLAALTVVFHHLAMVPTAVNPEIYNLFLKASSPFSIFTKGHEAVIFFFVLSGFVLSLPLLDGRQQPYGKYLIKRFFRIYIPYIVSVFVSLLLLLLFQNTGGAELGNDIGNTWTHKISAGVVWEHILGIVNVHTKELNGVYWSLVHEMRISIFFPFAVLLLMRMRWQFAVASALMLSAIGMANFTFTWEASNGTMTSYLDSLHYLSFFLYGALLAQHRTVLIAWFKKLRPGTKLGILTLCFITYNYSVYFITALYKAGIVLPFDMLLRDQINAIGVSGFLIAALASRRIGAALQTRIPVFFGNISYSLYLYHMAIMLAIVHGFRDQFSLPYLLALTVIVSVLLAYIGYRLIELPALECGRWLTNRLARKTTVSSAESYSIM